MSSGFLFYFVTSNCVSWAFLLAQWKESACTAGDAGSIPGSKKEAMANLFSILAWEINPMDRGAWQATVSGVTKSQI